MKKQLIVLFSLLSITISASAQKEYKLAKSSGQLNLNISGAIIEGYSGNEIIFSLPTVPDKVTDERAKGLRAISGSGFVDNSGLGIEVSEKGSEINVNPVVKDLKGILTIKVPQNIKVVVNNSSNTYYSEIFLKNLKNEIEVSTSFNKIKLENNTGPMSIKALHGSVDAVFSDEIKGPVSIISVYGYVDVSLPRTAKANIELSTNYGKLFSAEGLKIDLEKSSTEKNNTEKQQTNTITTSSSGSFNFVSSGRSNSDSIKGKVNGGGANLILTSTHGNVYLREK